MKIYLIHIDRKPHTLYIHHYHFIIDKINYFPFFIGVQDQYNITELVFHNAKIREEW